MRYIHTDKAPIPAGHYSQATVHAGVVYVSGQVPINPAAPDAPLGSVADQARQTLENVEQVLIAAGSGIQHVLRLTIFVSDSESWGTVNEVVAERFGDHRPARAIIPCAPLKRGFALEITATAALAEPLEEA